MPGLRGMQRWTAPWLQRQRPSVTWSMPWRKRIGKTAGEIWYKSPSCQHE